MKMKNKRLESIVKRFKPVKDVSGRYVPYCDFGFHQGYVVNYERCVDRSCKHYHKLYI